MKRRALVAGMAAVMAVQWAAAAQPPSHIPRIGVVNGASPSPTHPVRSFQRGLRELGYVEGRSIVVEYRWAHGEPARIPELVADLLRLRVAAIVAGNTAVAVAAQKASSTIPIVMAVSSDPIEKGLIAGFAKPGGNVTGMAPFLVELTTKQMELLREMLPEASRIAVLWNPAYGTSEPLLRAAELAAPKLRVRLHAVAASGSDEYEAAFAAMSKVGADGLLVLANPTYFRDRSRLAELAARNRLPTMYGISGHAEAGGLMAYSADFDDLFRRAAYFIDKILKGSNPADLPVERPVKFEFALNVKTAKALGVTIPPSLLLRADQVIE